MSKLTTTDDVVLGSGDMFICDTATEKFNDLEIGKKAFYEALEVEDYQIGHIQGGASLEYTSEWKKVKDDYKVIVKQFLTNEEVKLKGGILAWNASVLETLCATARVTEDNENHIKLVKIGGTQNTNGKKYFIHFRHKRDDGTYIRVTIVGICENGFTLAFDPEKETVLDPVFSAQAGDSEGTLVYYSEQKKIESSQSVKEEN